MILSEFQELLIYVIGSAFLLGGLFTVLFAFFGRE